MGTNVATSPGPCLSAAFVVLPDFTLMAFSGFLEALRHAADRGDRSQQIHCKWTVLGTDFRPVRSSSGVSIAPWELIRPLPEFDYLVVVGGLTAAHPKVSPKLIRFVRASYERGMTVVGLCTGSFILARAGILGTTPCCVHHYHLAEFQREFPDVRTVADELFVASGRIITCAGGSGAVDLAISLIEKHLGSAIAAKAVSQLIYEHPRPHSHPQPPVAAHVIPDIADPLVRRAILQLKYNSNEHPTVEELAERLSVSPRSLSRRFLDSLGVSPGQYMKRERVQLADWLLCNTDRKITEIAFECGFSDVSHFTRAYRAVRGTTPSRLRSGDRVTVSPRFTRTSQP